MGFETGTIIAGRRAPPKGGPYQARGMGMDDEGSEGFAVEDGAFGDLETEGFVDVLGEGVGEGCVGGEFAAALGAGPVFGGAEECGADALTAVGIRDVPAFDVADRVRFVAAFGVGAKAGFHKASESSCWSFRYENHQRQSGWRLPSQNESKLLRVFRS